MLNWLRHSWVSTFLASCVVAASLALPAQAQLPFAEQHMIAQCAADGGRWVGVCEYPRDRAYSGPSPETVGGADFLGALVALGILAGFAYWASDDEPPPSATSEPMLYGFFRELSWHESNDMAAAAAYFAPRVFWYERGYKSRDVIMREKLSIAHRYPNRDYRIVDFKSRAVGDGRVRANYVTRYIISNASRSRCGHWTSTVVVDTSRQTPAIIAVAGRDLNIAC